MHKCTKCARYNPGAVSNCVLAQSVINMEKRYGYTLNVTKCPLYEAKVKAKTRVWATKECDCEDGTCECEGEG